MIKCAIPRGSGTAKLFTAANRSYTTGHSSTGLHNGSANSILSTTGQVASTGGEGGGKNVEDTVIISDGIPNGKSGSKPYKPRDLPLSPFMDPEAIAAREKHHLPKLSSSKAPTVFQQQLAKNPYAQALATPVRQCQLTRLSMPRYFLQDFQVMAHPDTKEPWWVPMSLRKEHGDREAVEGKGQAQTSASARSDQDFEPPLQSARFDAESNTPSTNELEDSLSQLETQPAAPFNPHMLGPGTYVLSRRALISAMQNVSSGWRPQSYKQFFTGSLRSSMAGKKVRENSYWRTDMDTFILELMRRRVVEGLAYLVGRKRGYVARCVNWEDAKMASRQQAVILWTGKLVEGRRQDGEAVANSESKPDGGLSKGQGLELDGPPGFATLTLGRAKPHMVPVHNLPMLLGSEHLAELRKQCPIFEKELLIVKNKRITIDIQMKLWKLQGYLASPEPAYDKAFREAWNRAKKGLSLGNLEEDLEGRSQKWRGGDGDDDKSKPRSRRR